MIICLGLFLGLLTLVGGIIILIIFFVMKETPEYRSQMHWIYAGKTSSNVVFAFIRRWRRWWCLWHLLQQQVCAPSSPKPPAVFGVEVVIIGDRRRQVPGTVIGF